MCPMRIRHPYQTKCFGHELRKCGSTGMTGNGAARAQRCPGACRRRTETTAHYSSTQPLTAAAKPQTQGRRRPAVLPLNLINCAWACYFARKHGFIQAHIARGGAALG